MGAADPRVSKQTVKPWFFGQQGSAMSSSGISNGFIVNTKEAYSRSKSSVGRGGKGSAGSWDRLTSDIHLGGV
jgi:hypothetical protein